MAAKKHPLLNRYLNWGDGEFYHTFCVEEDLGNGFFLLRHVNPQGVHLASCRVTHLGQIMAAEDNVAFYDDLESVENWGEDLPQTGDPIVRLVPRMPDPDDAA